MLIGVIVNDFTCARGNAMGTGHGEHPASYFSDDTVAEFHKVFGE
ncbi:MAG: hypothetical protein ABF917_04370 [Gluconobacter oxydans]